MTQEKANQEQAKAKQLWSEQGLPKDGDYIKIKIPLIRKVEKYKGKDGTDKEFVSYAQVGNKFGGQPLGDGSLAIKFTVYPPTSKGMVNSAFELVD